MEQVYNKYRGENIFDMKPLISVIMPLYNAERFLEEALISISKQTFQNYELICIIDGADDNTADIIRKFQQRDSRIKMLDNGGHFGAAVARNRGIREAVGKYLLFLDGDDIFDEELFWLTFNKAEERDADIVMFEYCHAMSDDIYQKQIVYHSKEYIERFCNRTMSVNDIKVCDFLNWSSSPCNKLFRRGFVDHNCLEFQNLSNSNDTYFVYMAFLVAERIVVLDSTKVLVYARDHFTPSRISIERDPMCTYLAMAKLKAELKIRRIFHALYKIYNYNAFHNMIIGLNNTKDMEKREQFFEFLVHRGFNEVLETPESVNRTDQFLQEKINQFVHIGLCGEWQQNDFVFETFLEENMLEISKIFEDCKATNLKIGIWGAGRNGRKLITFCNRYNLDIDMVLDMDETKQGDICEGYLIQLPQKVSALDLVIATPTGIYASIVEMIRIYNRHAQVIDLGSLLCFN